MRPRSVIASEAIDRRPLRGQDGHDCSRLSIGDRYVAATYDHHPIYLFGCLPIIFNQQHISGGDSARAGHRLPITRPIKAEDVIGNELGYLLWFSSIDRLSPDVGHSFFVIEVQN